MQKKFRAIAMTIPLVLFALGEQQAHPLPEFEDAVQPAEAATPRAADVKTEPAKQSATPKTSRAGRKPRKAPRILAKKARKPQPRRKSRRESTASIAARRLYILRREYAKRTKHPLIVTSFLRTPSQQAQITRKLIKKRGLAYVLKLYGFSPAIREIANAYRANRRSPLKAQQRMTLIIEKQMERQVYVSQHLRGLAADVRSRGRNGARLPILRDVARGVGAKVSAEPDHIHVRLV
ncbi:MAG TPA: hypothetical protein VF508_02910 [Pyrinomonadaceae bacterium]|jgi:hypothetical protein